MLPNETNRIVWYENVGSLTEPRFGEQKFIVVEGYEEFDTAEARAASGRRESRQLAVCSACCLLVLTVSVWKQFRSGSARNQSCEPPEHIRQAGTG